MIKVLRSLPLLTLTLLLTGHIQAQFGTGHIAVIQGDAVANNTTIHILELNTTTPNQTNPISSKAIGDASTPFRISASAGTTGYLSTTKDGSLLCFTGVNTASTGNANGLNPRAVGTLDGNQNFSIKTTYTGNSGQQTRAATSLNNTDFIIADQSGIYINGATSPDPAVNVKSAKAFGNTVYIGNANMAPSVQVGTLSGNTLTGLPGLGAESNFQDFYMLSSNDDGVYDILYVVASSSVTAGTITKYSLVSGAWTVNGTPYSTGFGGFGLTAQKTGTGPTAGAELYLVSGNNSTGGNSLMKVIDGNGYNTDINITATSTLYTATSTTILKGLAFAPAGTTTPPPPNPTVTLSASTTTASEAAGTVVTLTATASAPVTGDQSVSVSVSGNHLTGSDYSISGIAITIPNGATTSTATLTIIDDNEVEDPEKATITIGSPTSGITVGTPSSVTISIADNDVSSNPMRITEYMYNSSPREFVEFTNTGATDIDMTGWSYSDNGETPGAVSLSAFGIVHPGESVILTENTESDFRSDWNLCNGVKIIGGNTVNLGRADEINLYDNNGILIDRLTYDDQNLGGPRTDGKSAWVSSAALGRNIITSWTLSTVGDGEASVTAISGSIGSPGKSSLGGTPYNPCTVVDPGTPTIDMDVTTTSNLIDGGATVPPANAFTLSGVTNDATDPVSTLGIAFTIGDDATPVNSLTVTVSSDNQAVVPDANLPLTGAGASRLLKITPLATGYANITLDVYDGTLHGQYVLHYAASESATASSRWFTGIADASAAIPLDDDYMVIADDEHNMLYVYNRNSSGLPVKKYDYSAGNGLNLTDGSPGAFKEVDVEASAPSPTVGGRSYWLGSMSNGSDFSNKPNRDRVIGVDISGTGSATSFTLAGYIAGLRNKLIAWGDANSLDFTNSAKDGVDAKTDNGFNIEGMAFAPNGSTLYIGFRAPLIPVGHKAIIAPIENFEDYFNGTTTNPTIDAPIEFDLGGRGIRDIVRLPNGTYVIVAGSTGATNIPALFRWTGDRNEVPVQLTSFDLTGLNAEAVLPVNEGGQLSLDKLQVINDDGDHVFYGDNVIAKNLSNDNLKKFTSTLAVSSIPGVLPVKFESFTAIRQGSDVRLDWKTGAPGDVASFDVLRSTNGVDFSHIATVTATSIQTAYGFVDQNTPTGRLYYRIQSNEYTGNHSFSTIRVVGTTSATEAQVKVYPNPVTNNVFTITTGNMGVKTVSVFTDAGVLYQQLQFSETAKDIPTSSWPRGYYLLRITLADGTQATQKLIVQ
ncbi:MAG: DUF3616 domain-containing protein [Bacteroidetes bacterium]|nr:DUF3616 domain-containing protein [Bacteroidota bacterium]